MQKIFNKTVCLALGLAATGVFAQNEAVTPLRKPTFEEVRADFYRTHGIGTPKGWMDAIEVEAKMEQEERETNWLGLPKSRRELLREAQKEAAIETILDGPYTRFKRWEWYWEQHLMPDGTFPPSDIIHTEWKNYRNAHPEHFATEKTTTGTPWKFAGPSNSPGKGEGIGRLNCIAFHPADVNTFWVGSPSGGLWKTTNGGTSWTTTTDELPVLGVSSIVIDYTDPDVIYIATGDREDGSLAGLTNSYTGDTKSIGVLKSTDGGATWNTTGFSWNVTQEKRLGCLVMHPSNHLVLQLAASDGMYKSTDGGATWTRKLTGNFIDVIYSPANENYILATGRGAFSQMYRSTDNGETWTKTTNIPNVVRGKIAVTKAEKNLVEVIFVTPAGGLDGLYRSVDTGATFTRYFAGDCVGNNLLANPATGDVCAGQGQYDLTFDISPLNANNRIIGGINAWRSTDKGATWSIANVWNAGVGAPAGTPVVHADKHWHAYHPLQPTTLLECSDGGIARSTDGGKVWTDIASGLHISQMYRIGAAPSSTQKIMAGLQDNGTKGLSAGTTWIRRGGGDGMECAFDYSDEKIQYNSVYNGVFRRTTNSWSSNVSITSSINASGNEGEWVTPFVIDPTTPQTIYIGYSDLFRSTNRGNSWTKISSISGILGGKLRSIAVSPVSSNIIYVASISTVATTFDAGGTWVTTGLPNGGVITYLATHPTDPLIVYATKAGFSAGNKVYRSDDGGVTWTNMSGTLPNVSTFTVVFDPNNADNEAVYVGTDVGVFYRDINLTDWVPFNDGLPNVPVTELEVNKNLGKIWAGTYGRGAWINDLKSVSIDKKASNALASLTIAPNPTSGRFTVSLKENAPRIGTQGQIVLTDMAGRELQKVAFAAPSTTLDMAAYANGVYIVSLTDADGTVIARQKVVKQ